MRVLAKTLLYWKGHFVAEGQEADMPQDVAERFIKAGKASALTGGKGNSNQLIDVAGAPAPVANLRPVPEVTPKAPTEAPTEAPKPARKKKAD